MIQLELPLKNTSSTTGFFNYSQGITLDRPERLQLQSRNGTTGPSAVSHGAARPWLGARGLADKRPQREEAGLGVLALSLASEKFQVLCTTASQNLCVFSTFISDGCHQEETGDCW